MVGHERTSSVVNVDSLVLLAYNTSDSESDSRGKLTSGASMRSSLVERAFADTFDNVDFTVVRLVVARDPVCQASHP